MGNWNSKLKIKNDLLEIENLKKEELEIVYLQLGERNFEWGINDEIVYNCLWGHKQ